MKKTVSTSLSILLLLLAFVPAQASAQNLFELQGLITDETGAFIVAAPVTLDDGQGQKYSAQTDEQGRYRITGIKPGVYNVTVEVDGFATYTDQVDLSARRATPLNITLTVALTEQVEVTNDTPVVSTEPDQNLSAVTLTEKDLEALPDDPDELLETLRQMAGAAGGADDAAIYVGGFRENGRIPPKEAIQMIRINANPYSAEYSEPGNARIEIITKPGSDVYHGALRFGFRDESLNARDVFAPSRAPFQVRDYGGNVSGPIIRNRWGFFLDFDRRERDENDVVNATILAPGTFAPTPFTTSVASPTRNLNFSLRTDFLINPKHTLGVQYRFTDTSWLNLSSGFELPERQFQTDTRDDTFRFSFTSIASERAVNEMRLQLSRRQVNTRALTEAPAVQVFDAFTSGGNQNSLFADNRNQNLEFVDNLTYTYKKHTIKAGFRAEGLHLETTNRGNFGGTFTFGSDFERDAAGEIILDGNGNPVTISSLEHYRRFITGVPGYRPSQFSVNRGDPFISLTQWEMGLFVQDDWKASEQLTLSFGVRHEFQTNLEDKLNLAPRVGLAWAPVKNGKGVIRAAAGVFYSRLDSGITTNTFRFDGERLQEFVIDQPDFYLNNIPVEFTGANLRQPRIRTKADDLNAPYTIMSTVGYERRLPKNLLGAVTYTWTRGVHLLRSRNINAPVNGDEPGEAPELPFPGQGSIFQYESTGLLSRHELRFMLRANITRDINMFGFYTLSSTRGNAELRDSGLLPADSYDLSSEWGRTRDDVRHRIHLTGSVGLPWRLRISPHIQISSGAPFNITTGRDNNLDTIFNDRPSFAMPGDPDAIQTRFGLFNPNPGPGDEIIPRNFGNGPSYVVFNVNLSKTIGFGPQLASFRGQAGTRNAQQGGQQTGQQTGQQGQQTANRRGNNQNRGGGAGARGPGGPGGGGFFGGGGDARNRYNLTFNIQVSNIFNHTNFGNYNGVLSSPVFGLSSTAREARRVEASVRFSF